MKLTDLTKIAINKDRFSNLTDYIDFCKSYLNYIKDNLQATIISQNEHHYQFYQYNEEGYFQISRPTNSKLMYDAEVFSLASKEFIKILKSVKKIDKEDCSLREIINCSTYTIQQSIGCTLDALPAGESNKARKLNGDLFESFIRLIIREIGVNCNSGVVKVPIMLDEQEQFKMCYQHDLIIKDNDEIKVIGSIKTSSKDRVDKIFIDKFLYNKLTEKTTPHIAIFLNDVQRKNTKHENQYGISSTFLPGHFKGYTVKLNPLDGVYYCDIRPNMIKDHILNNQIKTFDRLLVEDIWKFI